MKNESISIGLTCLVLLDAPLTEANDADVSLF